VSVPPLSPPPRALACGGQIDRGGNFGHLIAVRLVGGWTGFPVCIADGTYDAWSMRQASRSCTPAGRGPVTNRVLAFPPPKRVLPTDDALVGSCKQRATSLPRVSGRPDEGRLFVADLTPPDCCPSIPDTSTSSRRRLNRLPKSVRLRGPRSETARRTPLSAAARHGTAVWNRARGAVWTARGVIPASPYARLRSPRSAVGAWAPGAIRRRCAALRRTAVFLVNRYRHTPRD